MINTKDIQQQECKCNEILGCVYRDGNCKVHNLQQQEECQCERKYGALTIDGEKIIPHIHISTPQQQEECACQNVVSTDYIVQGYTCPIHRKVKPTGERTRIMEELKPEVAYTIATGRLFCNFDDLQETMERIFNRPVYTHEFANKELWDEARKEIENYYTKTLKGTSQE